MPPWLVIGISGVTCGGKTTLAHSLRDYFLEQRNMRAWNTPYIIGDVQLMSQDDYFLPVDDLRHKWNDKLNAINFELLSSLDMKRMLSDITWTMKGRYLAGDHMENIDYINEMSMSTSFEHYAPPPPPTTHLYQNHYTHHHGMNPQQHQHHPQHQQQQQRHHMNAPPPHIMRVNSQFAAQMRDTKINILIIEGFIIFNQPELLTLCNIKFHLHLPYEKCYDRRQLRTYDPPDVTGYFEICVWPQYEKNFNEFRDRQDIIFLNGELSKERIFKFVLQKIGMFVEESCDVACPPPHKLLGIPSCMGGGLPSISSVVGMGVGSVNVNVNIGGNGVVGSGLLTKGCPMEQQ